MSKYTAEQVLYAAQLEEDTYDGDLIIVQYLRDYAALLREREAASAGVTDEVIRLAIVTAEKCSNATRIGWDTMRAALEAAAPMLAKLRKHDFYNAGEKDCPADIKCSNGELHTLRCRNCGLDNPDDYCSALNQEKEHPVARVMISESGKFSIQALPGMALKLCNGQELYGSPMLASARVPNDPTEEMLVAARDWSHRKYGKPIGNDAATGCWQAMLAAAPKPEEK